MFHSPHTCAIYRPSYFLRFFFNKSLEETAGVTRLLNFLEEPLQGINKVLSDLIWSLVVKTTLQGFSIRYSILFWLAGLLQADSLQWFQFPSFLHHPWCCSDTSLFLGRNANPTASLKLSSPLLLQFIDKISTPWRFLMQCNDLDVQCPGLLQGSKPQAVITDSECGRHRSAVMHPKPP